MISGRKFFGLDIPKIDPVGPDDTWYMRFLDTGKSIPCSTKDVALQNATWYRKQGREVTIIHHGQVVEENQE